jgi:radical SAM-linked protein
MRLRIRYAKLGKVRFTSHRDTARIWERALRRVGLRVATTGGFTPRPRVSFGLALPTGAESLAEYLDIELVAEPADVGGVVGELTEALPVGFTALVADEVAAPGSLQEVVTSVTWELALPDVLAAASAVDRLLAAATLPLERERKGERRVDDVRPQIRSLATAADGTTVVADLATVGRGLRPAELAAVAFPGIGSATLHAIRATRTHQWIEHDGDRREVLALPDAVPAPKVGA